MRIIISLFLIQQICSLNLAAQAIGSGGGVSGGSGLSFDASSLGASIQEKEASAPKTIGTIYMDDNWNMGEIHLLNKQVVKGFPLKYDIKNNTVEVKVYSKIKVCPIGIITKFNWKGKDQFKTKEFVNCKGYEFKDGTPLIGFFETIYNPEQRHKLFAKTNLRVIKPDYNIALDIGDRDSKIVKKNQYYLIDDNTVFLIEKNKRKSLILFQEKAPLIKRFMKKNKLKFNEENDLIKVIEYYNSLE